MAYINPQLQIDQEQQARSDRNYKSIGDSVINGITTANENRQRALAARNATQMQDLQFAKDGISSDAIKQARETGDFSGVQKLYSDIADVNRQTALNNSVLDGDVKRSTTLANNRKGLNIQSKMSDKDRIDYSYNKSQEAKKEDETRGVDISNQKKISEKNIGLVSVKNAMDEALTQLQNDNISEDEKIKVGQGLFKLLNSAEGADAVGAEEAKRVGSYLEYNLGNFTQPGAFIGRDLKGFTNQVKNYSDGIGGRIKRNEETANGLKQGKSFTQMIDQGKSNISPDIVKKVQTYTPEQAASRREELLRKQALGGQ